MKATDFPLNDGTLQNTGIQDETIQKEHHSDGTSNDTLESDHESVHPKETCSHVEHSRVTSNNGTNAIFTESSHNSIDATESFQDAISTSMHNDGSNKPNIPMVGNSRVVMKAALAVHETETLIRYVPLSALLSSEIHT